MYFFWSGGGGLAGSSLLCRGFSLAAAGRSCSLVEAHRLLVAMASLVAEHRLSRHTGLAALQHVESSPIRGQSWVSCTGRQILYHWATREALSFLIYKMAVTTRYLWLRGLNFKYDACQARISMGGTICWNLWSHGCHKDSGSTTST